MGTRFTAILSHKAATSWGVYDHALREWLDTSDIEPLDQHDAEVIAEFFSAHDNTWDHGPITLTVRRSCSCGEAWADEPGHDDNPAYP